MSQVLYQAIERHALTDFEAGDDAAVLAVMNATVETPLPDSLIFGPNDLLGLPQADSDAILGAFKAAAATSATVESWYARFQAGGIPLGVVRTFFAQIEDTLPADVRKKARLLGARVSTPAQNAIQREWTQADTDAARRWNDIMPWLLDKWTKASADFEAGAVTSRDDVRAIFQED